jgi:hypothetical protein
MDCTPIRCRNVQHYDQPTIRVIARESARQNYTFASLVLGVVNSVPFFRAEWRRLRHHRRRGDRMTFLTRKTLTRRTMLKGMGASVAATTGFHDAGLSAQATGRKTRPSCESAGNVPRMEESLLRIGRTSRPPTVSA